MSFIILLVPVTLFVCIHSAISCPGHGMLALLAPYITLLLLLILLWCYKYWAVFPAGEPKGVYGPNHSNITWLIAGVVHDH